MQALSRVVERSHEIVWGVPTLLLLTGVGVLLSVRTRFVQIRRFGAMLRLAGGAFSRRERTRGGVSPLQAMCMALGATVGTGNIAGVAGAIALGGPGAVFWMWVSAILGMATKYAEAVLAVKFRVCDGAGGWVGGPMYYIRALHARMRPLAAAFALFGALAAFGIGNMAQVNTVANAVCTAAESVFPEAAAARQKICATVGILCALAVAAVLLGGAAGVGRVASRLVPAMSLLYIVAALAVILANLPGAARALGKIVRGAFAPEAVLGGTAGVGFSQTLRCGFDRGIFSHEAGMGSSPLAHAMARTDTPDRQGLLGIFEVFADTLVICTLTALAILSSGVEIPYARAAGAELTVDAFAVVFGARAAAPVIATGVALFALSSVLTWALYGESCFAYLCAGRARAVYRAAFALAALAGATLRLEFVWTLSGVLNGLMALPNLIALALWSGAVAVYARTGGEKKRAQSGRKSEEKARLVCYPGCARSEAHAVVRANERGDAVH